MDEWTEAMAGRGLGLTGWTVCVRPLLSGRTLPGTCCDHWFPTGPNLGGY